MTPLKLAEIAEERYPYHPIMTSHERNVQDHIRAAFIAGDQRDRWISVETELPKEQTRVLAAFQGVHMGVVVVAGYMGNGEWYSRGENLTGAITHWMPLPSPPTTEKGGEQ